MVLSSKELLLFDTKSPLVINWSYVSFIQNFFQTLHSLPLIETMKHNLPLIDMIQKDWVDSIEIVQFQPIISQK